jgi:hypothetical protein
MYAYVYTKATFFSSVTVVKMLKLSRLISEMQTLQSLQNQVNAGGVATPSCSGGNCFTPDDRTALVANLGDLIAQFQGELQLVQGGAKSQFKEVGPFTWAMAILAVVISLYALAGAFATSALVTIGAAAVLVVYGVTLGVTAFDMKSSKFQKSTTFVSAIVCNGNSSANTKFIARLTGGQANAFASL